MITRFHFADHGQDFLWWDVKHKKDGATGQVVDAGPCQAQLWADGNTFVNLKEPHGLDDHLTYTTDLIHSIKTGFSLSLKYPIAGVERREEAA